jgi:murein DD-endopeptidase MepM/ murein hydrolase activator NlpD
MKPGSVLVRSGDRVKQGQQVGAIGFAGDSIFPHLHYSLMSGPEVFKAWGFRPIFCISADWWEEVQSQYGKIP